MEGRRGFETENSGCFEPRTATSVGRMMHQPHFEPRVLNLPPEVLFRHFPEAVNCFLNIEGDHPNDEDIRLLQLARTTDEPGLRRLSGECRSNDAQETCPTLRGTICWDSLGR